MEKFRYRKDEHKVLGAGEYSVEHDSARRVIWTGLYEGETIVALLVATDDDAHQNEIDRIGNKIVRAFDSREQLVAALRETLHEAIDQYDAGPDDISEEEVIRFNEVCRRARAALAAAGAV